MPASCDVESEVELFSVFLRNVYFDVRSSSATPCVTVLTYTDRMVIFLSPEMNTATSFFTYSHLPSAMFLGRFRVGIISEKEESYRHLLVLFCM
jgi:hypothetical protein